MAKTFMINDLFKYSLSKNFRALSGIATRIICTVMYLGSKTGCQLYAILAINFVFDSLNGLGLWKVFQNWALSIVTPKKVWIWICPDFFQYHFYTCVEGSCSVLRNRLWPLFKDGTNWFLVRSMYSTICDPGK